MSLREELIKEKRKEIFHLAAELDCLERPTKRHTHYSNVSQSVFRKVQDTIRRSKGAEIEPEKRDEIKAMVKEQLAQFEKEFDDADEA
jgi:hypothetical protein